MDDTLRIVQTWEDSNILWKRVSETSKNEKKIQ